LSLDSALTFHSFRRSAASLAPSAGLPLQAIQTHGTWTLRLRILWCRFSFILSSLLLPDPLLWGFGVLLYLYL
jgi:hypothetical protein